MQRKQSVMASDMKENKSKKQRLIWSDAQKESLINLWESEPVLFDINSDGYRDATKRLAADERIQSVLDGEFTVDDIRSQMEALRTYYGKLLQKVKDSKRSGNGADDVYTPQ